LTLLDGVLSVLQWEGDQTEALDQAESAYSSLLSRRLGTELKCLETEDARSASRVIELLGAADASTLRRVVLAPETCSRLLWGHPGRCDERDLWQYLTDALEVENARFAPPEAPTATRWSALGDLRIDGTGAAVVVQPTAAGVVVDTESPAAVCFDYSTLHRDSMELRHYEDPAERELALGRLEEAMRGIDQVSAALAYFVRRFTLVANVLVDRDSPKFTSGSTAQYIGRSLFCNAHLASADVELLAESLVHEAIHSLLYMHEACERWVTDQQQFTEDAEVESPWTGATLVVRPFLQACFVWFGLAHFWSLARAGSPFRPRRVEERLATARDGFLKGPLPERITDQAPQIAPRVLDLVREMQAAVEPSAARP
jgi:hypothetical protein